MSRCAVRRSNSGRRLECATLFFGRDFARPAAGSTAPALANATPARPKNTYSCFRRARNYRSDWLAIRPMRHRLRGGRAREGAAHRVRRRSGRHGREGGAWRRSGGVHATGSGSIRRAQNSVEAIMRWRSAQHRRDATAQQIRPGARGPAWKGPRTPGVQTRRQLIVIERFGVMSRTLMATNIGSGASALVHFMM